MDYDVLIIGGGPVGNYLASLLAREYRVLVVEKKGSFGGKACTGIIGAESYEILGFPKKAILNAFRGATFYSKIRSFEIAREEPQAYMVDRKTFEKELARQAVRRGAEYWMRATFAGFKNGKAVIQRPGSVEEVEARVYVGADGVDSRVAKAIGAKNEAEFLPGFEMEVVGDFERKDFVEVWVNREMNPDFFFWVAPVDEGLARVGTIGRLDSLYRFLRMRRLEPSRVVEFKAGSVGLGLRRPWVKGNVALIGDAALQLKPLTAGGIAYGAFAAHMLKRALDEDNLKLYEKYTKDLKREIAFGLRARRVYLNLSQEKVEELFEILGSREAIEVIESTASFDEHAKTIKALLRHPKLLARLLRFSPTLIKSLL